MGKISDLPEKLDDESGNLVDEPERIGDEEETFISGINLGSNDSFVSKVGERFDEAIERWRPRDADAAKRATAIDTR